MKGSDAEREWCEEFLTLISANCSLWLAEPTVDPAFGIGFGLALGALVNHPEWTVAVARRLAANSPALINSPFLEGMVRDNPIEAETRA